MNKNSQEKIDKFYLTHRWDLTDPTTPGESSV